MEIDPYVTEISIFRTRTERQKIRSLSEVEEKKVGIFRTRIERQKIQSLSEVEEKKIGIYFVYMGFYRAIHKNIAASTSDFFRPRPAASNEKNPRF